MRAPEFWRRDGLAARTLAPLAWAYGLAAALRPALVRAQRAPVKVLCVGNLVAGGAGKTPVAIALARRLAAQGVRAHLLSRGYGGRRRGPLRVEPRRHSARDVGDEALLLAAAGPAWVARDRAAGARAAAEAGADVLVLDDGLQDPGLAKDLSLLVVDGEYGLGNGRLIPAGPLREPPARGLAKVSAVVVMGEDRWRLAPAIARSGAAVLGAELVPARDLHALADRPAAAFAGIGRPQKFFAMLARHGLALARTDAFADHHAYQPDEVMRLVEAAHRLDARLVTTEKDHVRLPAEARPMVIAIAVEVAWEDEAALDRVLAPLRGGP